MAKLIFDSKENNNQRRESEFLALEPGKRFQLFLSMVSELSKFETKARPRNKGNFILTEVDNGI